MEPAAVTPYQLDGSTEFKVQSLKFKVQSQELEARSTKFGIEQASRWGGAVRPGRGFASQL
jgi:hypothetical protein